MYRVRYIRDRFRYRSSKFPGCRWPHPGCSCRSVRHRAPEHRGDVRAWPTVPLFDTAITLLESAGAHVAIEPAVVWTSTDDRRPYAIPSRLWRLSPPPASAPSNPGRTSGGADHAESSTWRNARTACAPTSSSFERAHRATSKRSSTASCCVKPGLTSRSPGRSARPPAHPRRGRPDQPRRCIVNRLTALNGEPLASSSSCRTRRASRLPAARHSSHSESWTG